jgi:hypothetical protein
VLLSDVDLTQPVLTPIPFPQIAPSTIQSGVGGFVARGDGTGAWPGLMQSGVTATSPDFPAADTTQTVAVTFPVPFPAAVPVANIHVYATPQAGNPGSNPRVTVVPGSITRTGCTLALSRSSVTGFEAMWIAHAATP